MDRVILHCDLNNFYASVECLHQPEIRERPVAVAGRAELRHGIILAKNYPAKSCGVKTGEAIWQAKQKCPELLLVPPNFSLYLRFARLAREIYADYTDQVESFGIDECWLDVTKSIHLFGDGKAIADTIRERIKAELGITASVGVSFNKITAKLGSDLRKPDATTVIDRSNYQAIVYPVPVQELLYVGPATYRKLRRIAITTIGDLAGCHPETLRALLGKWGLVLSAFARGEDASPVTPLGMESVIKSIGNSITTARDLVNTEDVKLILYILAESVATRLRRHGFRCRTVQIYVRDNQLNAFERQSRLPFSSCQAAEIAAQALELFTGNWSWPQPIRSLGVRGCELVAADQGIQLSFLADEERRMRQERLEHTVDRIRERFGPYAVQRGISLSDRRLGRINPVDEHVIHPLPYFK